MVRNLISHPWSSATLACKSALAVKREVRFKPKPGLCIASHGPTLVLLDLDSETYFALDEVGARIWRLLEAELTIPMIVEQISREYAVPVDRVWSDIQGLLEDLCHSNLVMKE
jgi:hypothetical protein